MRKRKKKEKVETHNPTILPTLLVPPQSEGDEMVDTKLALFSSQEDDSDLSNEMGMRHGVVKFWACHISTEKENNSSSPRVDGIEENELEKHAGILGPR
ncbi:hypothetical protein D623_10006373 [Myotis brandtii]|uniref:Uncharacterized protein n=1 Tax=Myotis brandtii TaxID=109478 RepID=S7P329_MYOBR|nr:hypothetical protein D623_10006373 [Myotis brandtii]